MLHKRLNAVMAASLCAALCTGAAFAQKTQDPGSHITVSKITQAQATGDNVFLVGMFTTIQEAVNNATEGQVIEILDTATYNEQVTIDGRTSHPWGSAIAGGKNYITIRYLPHSTQGNGRPKIVHQDTRNTTPTNCAQAQSTAGACAAHGDAHGCAGNYETNGALRIIRAQGVKIEGLVVDGGGKNTFGYDNVWRFQGCQGGTCNSGGCPLVHGNAAVAVAVSGGIQIRDCVLRNAHFGIAVKDRNTGGVFGNPNPSDRDFTIPLSGFGETGNHLFEYNKIGNNNVGIFFESSWDLGSTVRYNLIHNNFATGNELTVSVGTDGDKGHIGGIVFKDHFVSPVAIYNNTFYNNHSHLLGGWKIGYHHLIFNNIFGKPRSYGQNGAISHMAIIQKFPHRMKHNLIAADQSAPTSNNNQYQVQWNHLGANGARAVGSTIQTARGGNNDATVNFPTDANNKWFEIDATTFQNITDPNNINFLAPNYSNSNVQSHVRRQGWQPTTGGSSMPIITNEDGTRADLGAIPENGKRPGDAVPQKNRARISPFSVVTMNTAGNQATASLIVNNELGDITDLKVKYLRWVAPVPDNEASRMNDQIANTTNTPCRTTQPDGPLQNGCDASWGATGFIIRAEGTDIHNVTVPAGTAITAGEGTRLPFGIPTASANARYGFFEIVLEGKDGSGNTITTDVGFLPYRMLDYYLEIRVMRNGQAVTTEPVDVVAGEPVTIQVRAMNRNGTLFTTGTAADTLSGNYKLLPDQSARMWQNMSNSTGAVSNPLVDDPYITRASSGYIETYTVYFTKTGNTIVQGTGQWTNNSNKSQRLTFLGELILNVRPGVPAQVAFQQPVSLSQLCPDGATAACRARAPAILGAYDVIVQVQDRFGNPVDTEVTVNIRSESPDIGDVGQASGVSDRATGNVSFSASVTGGSPNDPFDMVATIARHADAGGGTAADTATLRVGRATDMLRVFFGTEDLAYEPIRNGPSTSGANYWRRDYDQDDAPVEISRRTGQAARAWVKVIANASSGDSVVHWGGYVCVTSSDPSMMLARDANGTPGTWEQGSISLRVVNGVAALWVNSSVVIEDARLEVSARAGGTDTTCAAPRLGSISAHERGPITFYEIPTGIVDAVVTSSDAWGRPTAVEITYTNNGADGVTLGNGIDLPQNVVLHWPSVCPGVSPDTTTSIEVAGDLVLRAIFQNPPDAWRDYTTFTGTSARNISLLSVNTLVDGVVQTTSGIPLEEKIGPLIAAYKGDAACGKPTTAAPVLTENLSPATQRDELLIYTTEPLGSSGAVLIGEMLQVKRGGDVFTVTVDEVQQEGPQSYKLTLTLGSGKLADGDSIRFMPGQVTDAHGNHVFGAANNPLGRYVRIGVQEVAPKLIRAWYTSDDATGFLDYAYIIFEKPVVRDDWFLNGQMKFTWVDLEGTYTIRPDNIDAITVMRDTVRIDLARAFPATRDPARMPALEGGWEVDGLLVPEEYRRVTSGTIRIDVTFGDSKQVGDSPWGSDFVVAQDMAAPVLVAAMLRIGSVDMAGDLMPDTLILRFSEMIEVSTASGLNVPALLMASDHTVWTGAPNINVRFQSHTQSTTLYYIVDTISVTGSSGTRSPVQDDWAKINTTGNLIKDQADNEQASSDNHRVPLQMRYAKPGWIVQVRNNPFRGGGDKSMRIVLKPTTKAEELELTGTFTLYNSMGNVVVDTILPLQKYNAKTDAGKQDADNLVWEWNGRNKQGRYVGTGTYLLIANSSVKAGEETHTPDPIRRLIGFVRGKN